MHGQQRAVQRALDRVQRRVEARARRGSRGPRRRRSGRSRRRGTPRAPRAARRRRRDSRAGAVERGLGDVDREQRVARGPGRRSREHADRAADLEGVGEVPAFERGDRGVVLRRLVRAGLEVPRVGVGGVEVVEEGGAETFASRMAATWSRRNRNSHRVTHLSGERPSDGQGCFRRRLHTLKWEIEDTCLIGERSSWARSRLRCACRRPRSRLDEVNSKKLRDARHGQRHPPARAGAAGRWPTPTAAPARPARRATRRRCSTSRAPAARPATRVKEQEFTFPFFRELAPAVAGADLADAEGLRDRDVRVLGQR